MQSRKLLLPILALVILALGLAPSAFSQIAKTQSPFKAPHRDLGFYDRTTGAFTPLEVASEEVEPAVTTTASGEFIFNFTITLKSAVPTNAVIGCDANVEVADLTTGLSYGEQGSSIATGTGTTRTCTVKIFYSWTLTSPDTADMVSMSYDASMIKGYEATASNGTGTIVEPIGVRSSGHDLPTIKLPTAATTTETISVTL